MHIMIDLETMGTGSDAPIISIGAVAFNAKGIDIRGFYNSVDLQSSVTAGATIEPNTVMWWMQQSDEARAALLTADTVDIASALDAFDGWIANVTGSGPETLKGVWGNGASFDNVIVAETYKRLRRSPPWPFWKDRCYRTIKSMYPNVKVTRKGTHHNALDDARYQAEHLIAIHKVDRNIL
jgi:exodeoxyribonuclease VIII